MTKRLEQSEDPIQTRVLPSGYVLHTPVKINEVTATAVKRIKYSRIISLSAMFSMTKIR